jgi:transposase
MVRKKSTTFSLTVLRPNAAGVDIAATTIHVALPPDRDQTVREFGTFTCDLNAIADWLIEYGITTVAMESTSVYWIPLFQILEERGIEVFLVNAHHVKAVPGRPKTDIKDAQWLQYLHSVGLLNASFRPEAEIAAIRSLMRHRDTLIQSSSQQILRMQKALTQMNVKLHNVISDITGVTGLAIIDAILSGQRDTHTLAQLKDRRIKCTKETIAKSLEGDYRPELIFTLKQTLAAYRFIKKQVEECDAEIQRAINSYNREKGLAKIEKKQRVNSGKKLRLRDARDWTIHAEMYQAFGIDLFELPGFATNTVLSVFTEVGTDFSKFRTAAAFASWLALCPNNQISGGKILRTKARHTKSRLSEALRQAAYSLASAKSHYGQLYRRLRAKFGAPKAVKAMANKLARLLYHLVTTRQEFDETRIGKAEAHQLEREFERLKRKARAHGFELTPAI